MSYSPLAFLTLGAHLRSLTRILLSAAVAALFSTGLAAELVDDQITLSAKDWPWWRGPQRNGIADPDQTPPIEWSESKNILWQAPIPGRGDSSPTVVGKRIYLATADEDKGSQSVLCFDRETGNQLWETVVHPSGLMRKNRKSTGASSTVACDGAQLYINFANNNAVYLTALDLRGDKLWQEKIADYKIHQGYGASPAIYQDLVIAAVDSHAGGAIAAFDRKSGKRVWKQDRPEVPNYTSPIILHVDGKDQLLFTGCDLVSSFDPRTGEVLWETSGATTECVTSIVTDGTRVFSSGGYPRNHLAAYDATKGGMLVWETNDRVYVPSLLCKDGYLYGLLDAGIAACWNSATGEEQWKKRLGGGELSASPVLVGNKIYATSETGTTVVYSADPSGFEEIARNQLGDEVMATPTICGSRIYLRVAHVREGKREEILYCVASE